MNETNETRAENSNKTGGMKDTDYLYVSSRLKSLEVKNITRERFEKMIDAKSIGDAVSVLAECEYGDGTAAAFEGAVNYEQLFISEQKKVYDLIAEISPNPAILTFFKYQNDCHNLKSIIKSEFMNREPDAILIDLGSVDTSTAKTDARERTFAGFAKSMAAGADDAIGAYSKNKDPMMIDIIIDKACFADMVEIAEESGCEFLTGLVRRKIDLANIMITIRIARMKNTPDLLRKTLISGGNLDEIFFTEAFDPQQENKLYDALKYQKYSAISDFSEANQGQAPLSGLEKLCEEIYFAAIKEARFIPYGAEVVIGYIASKELEIKNARIVMCGKETSLSGDVIRERLRAVYA
jgi:V/A-type H+-transporting ATPase subunit C